MRSSINGTTTHHRHLVRVPRWYRTPRVQTCVLGIIFFWVFASYTTMQFYSMSTYGPLLASRIVSSTYVSFALCCLISPNIVNKFGCRNTMLFGILGYAVLVVCSLAYFTYGSDGDDANEGENDDDDSRRRAVWIERLVVAGGAILGCGASSLWTAQGRLILQYGSRAEGMLPLTEWGRAVSSSSSEGRATTVDDDGKTAMVGVASSSSSSSSSQTGELMGIFWAIFQCSSIVGGSISLLYYGRDIDDHRPRGSIALYVLFLIFIVIGALSTRLLLPPSMLRGRRRDGEDSPTTRGTNSTNVDGYNDEGDDIEMITDERSPLAAYVSDRSTSDEKRERTTDDIKSVSGDDDLSRDTWTVEAMGTLRLFLTSEMMCLSPLFFYTGFNQPYQQATFGNRFFTRRTIGAELIVFHLMEIVGAIIVGRFLDGEWSVASTRRTRAVMCLTSFVVINSMGNIFAAVQEYDARANDGNPIAHDISDASVVSPSLAFACWGFADAQIQVFCYWLMGGLYKSGRDHSRGVGFYKLVQSLGTSIGFYLIPTSRLSEISQLAFSSLVFLLGTAMSFSQLPSA